MIGRSQSESTISCGQASDGRPRLSCLPAVSNGDTLDLIAANQCGKRCGMLAEPHALKAVSLALSTCTGNTGNHDAIDGPRPSGRVEARLPYRPAQYRGGAIAAGSDSGQQRGAVPRLRLSRAH